MNQYKKYIKLSSMFAATLIIVLATACSSSSNEEFDALQSKVTSLETRLSRANEALDQVKAASVRAQVIGTLRHIEAAEFSDGFTYRHQLIGVTVRTGGIGQSGSEPEGPVPHPLSGQILHPGDLLRGGCPVFPAHRLYPDGCVRHHVDHVAGRVIVQKVEIFLDAAPPDAGGRLAIDGGEVGQKMF